MTANPPPETSLPALRAALLRQVRASVASDADAEDVVQDLLVRMWDRRESLDGVENLEFFLRRAATNAVRDHHRRNGARSRATERAGDEPLLLGDEEVDADLDGPVNRELLIACVEPFLHTLPPTYRQAIELTHLAGLTQAEAAKKLGLSPTGMRSRVQRGRALLRQRLLACCEVAVDGRGRAVSGTPRDPCAC
ncbi:MAG: sigma-70 family RNA polymerase sigma factor [Deltaproteobacteria bacterium]|nr:sigma-70 family RNA polymerase sigma factor [Deltaproteobacteria bacterium]